MLLRISNLVWKEIIQFIRDRMMAAFIFMLPILQLMLMAQATGTRIGNLSVAVLDLDHSRVSRQLIAQLDNRQELNVRYFATTEQELQQMLDRGQIDAGVILPRGLALELDGVGRTAQVHMIVDGSNSIVGSVAMSAAGSALLEYGQEMLEERGETTQPLIDLNVVTYYNPAYETRPFTIPAQLGFITYQITLAVASLGLARERELGTLEQLVVAPLSRLELVIGKAAPALIVAGSNFLLLLGVAIHIFAVPMRGSMAILLGMTTLFIASEIGWGVLISAASRTQQQAILLVFILAIVDVTFSGYLVPVKNLPGPLRLVALVVPLYHYMIIVRAVMLKGAGLATLWPHAVALVGLGAAILGISARGVSRRLD
ncbi:MAG: ABC transporter permease [Anaerolineae bacterium]|nr:ABC transporter permease [Anaerolineae bacterium]